MTGTDDIAGLARVRLSRRGMLMLSAMTAAAASSASLFAPTSAVATARTVSAAAGADPAPLDQAVGDLMARWHLPGAQVALAQDGHLVLSQAYGLADVETNQPVQQTSLFRIASVSKPITAIAILRLIDQGRLTLDTPAFPLLPDLPPPAHAQPDPRLDTITIQDLLQHAGGWNSSTSYDPQYVPWTNMAAGVLGIAAPPSARDIIRFMRGQPLDFDPGAGSAYSNFGYNVLGRVIEQVTGQNYDSFVQAEVLQPSGITDMRLGRTRLAERAPNEVRYYTAPGERPVVPSVFPGEGYAPPAYGGTCIEAIDAHGGWLASAEDLVRFMTAIDGQRGQALLAPETVQTMLYVPSPPPAPGGSAGAGNARTATGLCWIVTPEEGGVSWSHAGALENTSTSWVIRTPDGLALAIITNSFPPLTEIGTFFPELISAMRSAMQQVVGLATPALPVQVPTPA